MQAHRFAVGEIVLYAERRHPQFTWKVPYTIISCIRTDAAEPQYRIASVHRDEIRTAGEHELCRTLQPLPAVQQSPEQFLEALSCLRPANLNLKSALESPLPARLQHSRSGAHHV
ncbi:hypothetical protein DC522_26445 [Microvirga sp. KLBC 81]|uniref:hypothetical protein n=1 Tax=Microvirga sp. KLBC 81 TaxID=1862707 RepID=UPI000D50E99E|nr:hypothetical protein [Microvirga sp. KLBC 81]PVE21486.1 hypothetical protein DC522_26445 [Microvirga sp. KLBC 81]